MPEALLYNVWHPKLRRLLGYWEEKRGDRPMPARADIDPIEIPDLLPNLMLANVHHAPLGFTNRLVGTGVVDLVGREITGEDPESSLPETLRRTVPALWRDCVATRLPTRADIEVPHGEKMRRFECVVLPLSDDGEAVNMLLASIWPRNEATARHRFRLTGERPRLRLIPGGAADLGRA